ncbi:Saccharopine dehydrogenase-domain-containing protein [Aspergillus bertholletiae]|uniref:Saccharopine dehydrogenase-domain-containing protein n=1 Tax=Aspergillus bertholletiae TaxID=1226010 RepID=A0A5N7AND0_9EURO|nr:Saccharopine dehydrogenase-domain-containing protein [Aspergillus bertholletiae]
MEPKREFDLILLGPTGYTGRLCAEHVVKNLPTDLKWALAGRSFQKIENVAKELKNLNPDRAEPEILAVQLNREELHSLAQKGRVLLNCVGPYHLYSTPVVEACASNGTHYLDVTGETPWVKSIIEKYHETAKSNGAIMIPSVGVESAPADILAWALVKRIREEFSCDTKEITCAIDEIKSSGASGGTLATVMTMFDTLSLLDILKAADPFALAASSPPKAIPSESLVEKVLGVRSIRDMGTLATAPTAIADITIVHRSSTLMPEFYGRRFHFRQFLRVRNVLVGVAVHFAFVTGLLLLLLPPVRWLLRKYIYAPGSGPRMEESVHDRLVYRAVATADQNTSDPKRALGKLKYEGTMYVFTGLLLAEAAMAILENEEKVKKVSRCGIVTPATLGQEYIDRLEKVGCQIETEVFNY